MEEQEAAKSAAAKKKREESVLSNGGYNSWDERFEELFQYQEKFGHTNVPQTSGALGEWVKRQREYYKEFLNGNNRIMTAHRASLLIEIGFSFIPPTRGRGRQILRRN